MQHDDTHDDRLIEIIANAEEPRAAFEGSDLALCAACQRLYSEYTRLGEALDRTGQTTREGLSQAAGIRSAPGEAIVEEVLRPLLEGGQPGHEWESRPPRVPWLALFAAVAAAALLIQFFVFDPFASKEQTFGVEHLGGSHGLALVRPVGSVLSWGEFGWESELPEGGWFAIRLGDLEGNLLHKIEPLRGRVWNPQPALIASWPDHIRWEVWLFDASGMQLDTAYGEAWMAEN